jgi:NAD(P)-dependent dehydrogenase (short-subunit alcohol dehydrogenase family)
MWSRTNRRKLAGVLSFLSKAAVSGAAVFAAKKLVSVALARELNLQDKVILITGGSRGLGLSLAYELGRLGGRIALCARNPDELQKACGCLQEKGIEAAVFPCDITDHSEIAPLIKRVVERFGGIDVLINNAGNIKVGPFESFDHSDYDYALNLMFWAPVNLTFAVLPEMKKRRGGGHIVNITSVGGRVSVPHLLPYSCAKFALVGFSRGLSTELSAHGIHVLTVVPGLMRTGSYLNAEFTGSPKDEFAWFGLLGNLPGFTVAAEYAARCIRTALQGGKRTCTISLPAKLLIASDALMPETTQLLLEFLNRRFLPVAKTFETDSGKALDSSFGKVFQTFTSLGKAAAARLNE